MIALDVELLHQLLIHRFHDLPRRRYPCGHPVRQLRPLVTPPLRSQARGCVPATLPRPRRWCRHCRRTPSSRCTTPAVPRRPPGPLRSLMPTRSPGSPRRPSPTDAAFRRRWSASWRTPCHGGRHAPPNRLEQMAKMKLHHRNGQTVNDGLLVLRDVQQLQRRAPNQVPRATSTAYGGA